ncbi:MAG: hypothetical protein QOE68_572 [Thermoanaerobaculia bacterium]|nr:hypothetical protein [Thermoanaerobaculia bacterium]
MFLATIATRGTVIGIQPFEASQLLLWLIPLAWLVVAFGALILSIVLRRPRFFLAAVLAIAVQGGLAWHVARVSSRLLFGDYSKERFANAAIFAVQRQSGDPRMMTYWFHYRGSGQVTSTTHMREKMFVDETFDLDGRNAAPLAEYIAQFPGEVRCKSVLDCLHPSPLEEDYEASNVTKTWRTDGGVRMTHSRKGIITVPFNDRRDMVPLFLYDISAVRTPEFVSLPEDRIYANFLTLAPDSTLSLTIPENHVASTAPQSVASSMGGGQERFEFAAGFPRAPGLAVIDHLFVMGAGVYVTFVKPAFATRFWIVTIRCLTSTIGLWLLFAFSAATAYLSVRPRRPKAKDLPASTENNGETVMSSQEAVTGYL